MHNIKNLPLQTMILKFTLASLCVLYLRIHPELCATCHNNIITHRSQWQCIKLYWGYIKCKCLQYSYKPSSLLLTCMLLTHYCNLCYGTLNTVWHHQYIIQPHLHKQSLLDLLFSNMGQKQKALKNGDMMTFIIISS